jgi:hypothetical protein
MNKYIILGIFLCIGIGLMYIGLNHTSIQKYEQPTKNTISEALKEVPIKYPKSVEVEVGNKIKVMYLNSNGSINHSVMRSK